MATRRVALGMLASATVSGLLAMSGPAFGQAGQSSGVSNSGSGIASTGGNQSAGNSSSNAAGNVSNQTTPPPAPGSQPLLGSVLGLVLGLNSTSANASDGTSTIQTGSAQAAGNTSDTAVSQDRVGASGGARGGIIGTVFNPFGHPAPAQPAQSAGVSNSGEALATTGNNSGVGNNSSNAANNNQTVNGGLIAIGLSLNQTASNTSTGTSGIATGPAQAAGNQSTTAIDQNSVGGGDGRSGGPFGFGSRGFFGIGGGVACESFFRFGGGQTGGQRVTVDNDGTGVASTGNNASVGNQSQNVANNESTVSGGLIALNASGLLGSSATNVSDGTSSIVTGGAQAAGNQSTTAVNQDCIQPTASRGGGPGFGHGPFGHDGRHHLSPPVITPGFRHVAEVRGVPIAQSGQLARTGRDPFIMGLVAFSLLFGGLMFLVWEKVEAYPRRSKLAG